MPVVLRREHVVRGRAAQLLHVLKAEGGEVGGVGEEATQRLVAVLGGDARVNDGRAEHHLQGRVVLLKGVVDEPEAPLGQPRLQRGLGGDDGAAPLLLVVVALAVAHVLQRGVVALRKALRVHGHLALRVGGIGLGHAVVQVAHGAHLLLHLGLDEAVLDGKARKGGAHLALFGEHRVLVHQLVSDGVEKVAARGLDAPAREARVVEAHAIHLGGLVLKLARGGVVVFRPGGVVAHVRVRLRVGAVRGGEGLQNVAVGAAHVTARQQQGRRHLAHKHGRLAGRGGGRGRRRGRSCRLRLALSDFRLERLHRGGVVGQLLFHVSEGGVGHFYRGAIFYCDRKAEMMFLQTGVPPWFRVESLLRLNKKPFLPHTFHGRHL